VIVVDASALLAIIQGEPEANRFLSVIRSADRALVSAVTVLETGIVLRARRGAAGAQELNGLLEAMAIEVVAFDAASAALALDAFERYGKGVNPKARLNLGDCVVYALAKELNAPLLFKGGDFAETDIASAPAK
jgi:ribonuclease VapC